VTFGDAGLRRVAGGEVAAFLGFPGAGPAGTARTENPGMRSQQNVASPRDLPVRVEIRDGIRLGGQGVLESGYFVYRG